MSRLDRHVEFVRNKMALSLFLRALAWTLLGFAIGVWIAVLLGKMVRFHLPREQVWFIAFFVGAVVAALAWAVARRPSSRHAAIAIDEKLQLKEKFSTALYARPVNDPFAAAAVRDAERTADNVSLARRFPVEFPPVAIATGVVALLVFLTAVLLPSFDLFGVEASRHKKSEQAIAQRARAEHAVRQAIAQIEATPRAVAESEPLKLAKQDLSDLLKRPIDDPDKAQRKADSALKEIDAIRDQIKQNQRYAEAQNQIKEFKSLSMSPEQTGPVADAARAMANGNFADAVDNIKDAVDKFQKMDTKEQQKTAQQMRQLAQQMQQMANDPRTQQQMQQQLQQMGASQQQARQMTQLMQQAANGNPQAQQQLQQMTNQLAQQMNQKQGGSGQQQQQAAQQVQQAIAKMQQQANSQASAQQMAASAQKLAQAMQQASHAGQPTQGQQSAQQANSNQQGQQSQGSSQQQMAQAGQSMQQQLAQLQAMSKDQQAVAAGQQGGQSGQSGQQGGQEQNGPDGAHAGNQQGQWQNGQWQKGNPNQQGQGGQGGPAMAAGPRPDPREAPYGVKQELTNFQTDEKGKILAGSFVKAGSIKGESKVKLSNDALKDYQEATDEVDEDRIPRSASHAVKDYFETLKHGAQ